MKSRSGAIALALLGATSGWANSADYRQAKVSFDDFKGLVAEVEAHRERRLVDLSSFLKMSREPGVVILDTRSKFRFDRIHVQGARHLAFTDFTQDNLRRVIPNFETKVLIYCNNNFEGNQRDFATKIALPRPRPRSPAATQFAAQEKPLMMALNIPTYINLYGYGYRNVYELHQLVDVNDPSIVFEGSIVERKPRISQSTAQDRAPKRED
jgi:rhodanese-related sulfurtransferase